jgi:glycerol-1-phosphate dehydrogenase [NAD(P)+]
MIYDKAIEGVIFPAIYEPLRAAGLAVEPFGMAGEEGHLLDSGVINGNQAAADIGPTADLLIAAGSGVISDMTKWIATRLDLPFIICGTAPSMNGYTSITATITENDIKVSRYLRPAEAIVLDVDILAKAPMPMIHAGIGDLAARAICNADWKLSQIQRKTSFCPLPHLMTAENERRYLAAAGGISRREPEAIELISEAILLSGLSMTILGGETSPSSGAEHVLSHFWDLLVHLRGIPKNFHGTQVGVGTIIMLNAYQYLREINPSKIDPQQLLRARPSLEAIEAENRSLYGDKADSFNQVAQKKRIPDAEYPEYVRSILDSWESIWEGIGPYVAQVDTIRKPFEEAGVPYHLSDIHRTPAEAREALLHGNHYRPRYTILDLLWELGLFPTAADEILERSGVL